jgi:RNA polymerase sigma-70 factor (ECF subfamily)
VYGFAKLYIHSDADIQDVVQDVFVKLWDMRENIRADQSLDNLLFIITRNHIFNLSRLKINQSQLHVTALQALEYESSYDASQSLNATELKDNISHIVDKLPPRRKEVFLMSRMENRSNAEIAQRLSISVRAVERHIYLSLSEIKKGLKAIYGDSPTQLFMLML